MNAALRTRIGVCASVWLAGWISASGVKARPPVADAGKDIVAVAGEETRFAGTGFSAEQEVVQYTWDFEGDGVADFISTTSGVTRHVFTEPGDYQCVLTVTDASGAQARNVRKVRVVTPGSPPEAGMETRTPPIRQLAAGDGVTHRYAVIYNGGSEERFWQDVLLCYDMLTHRYGLVANDVYVLNSDGLNPWGENPGGMIHSATSVSDLDEVVSQLAARADADDEISFWITGHGRGYSGPLSQRGTVYGYLDGRASIDPGDEPDFPESNFKLRALATYGDYIQNHGLNVWKIYQSARVSGTAFYRNMFVSHFNPIYVETRFGVVSDNDELIERLIDYPLGDFNRDGIIDPTLGEVFDYDSDGNPPYDWMTGQFDEDDWGNVDVLEDDFNSVNTQVPVGGWPYQIFDRDFQGRVCIDLGYTGGPLHVDGCDEDNMGLFDWLDANQDGDTNDIISIDEMLVGYSDPVADDDLREMLARLPVRKISILAEPCFSGGLVDDLSGSNRVISTAAAEDTVSWGNVFIRGFIAALNGTDENGWTVNADADGNGAVSILEAFNYAAERDFYDETPQYDDNGDAVSHARPVPAGGDGAVGAALYLFDFGPIVCTLSGLALVEGTVHFVLNASAGSNYVVEASSNLIHWQPISTNTVPAGGSVNVSDPAAAAFAQRFYRAHPH